MIYQPLKKILIQNDFCSVRSCQNFLNKTCVLVNGVRVFDKNFLVDTDIDKIQVENTVLHSTKHLYLLLNKPTGYVCSRVSDSHPTVFSLLGEFSKNTDLHICGRLDCDSSGLVVFTTNGSFSHFLTTDESVEKKYFVKLETPVTDEKKAHYIEEFSKGFYVPALKKGNAFICKPCTLQFLNDDECIVAISEGKFRQVRRMFGVLQNNVIELKRVSIGKIELPHDLAEGKFTLLESSFVRNLFFTNC